MTETEPAATPSKSSAKEWQARIAAADACRGDVLKTWRDNVNFRVMKPFPSVSTDDSQATDRVALPEDWSRTKAKTAELAFKLPKIVATATRPEHTAAAPKVTAAVNQTLRAMDTHYTVDECLADVINAAGIMAVVVGMDIREEQAPISTNPAVPGAPETPMKRRVYQRPTVTRVSPADLLWPAEFMSSNWRKARWLGYRLYRTENEIRAKWGDKIPESWEPATKQPESLADDVRLDKKNSKDTPVVPVTVVWYYAAAYDADKVHPECLRTLTFVDGVEEPVDAGDADEQIWVAETPEIPVGPTGKGSPAVPGHYEGLTRLPILVETLAYVSDLAIPPSDSQIGRSSVRELMRSRSQMIRQRDHSVPVRWFDVNRVDDEIQDALRAGRYQDWIPMNGPGDRAVGEVARAAYPRENFTFDAIIRQGLDQSWSTSNNQLGQPNMETKSATEVLAVGNATSKRSDYEKERVNRFIVTIAETTFSLMQRYETYPEYVEVVSPTGEDALEPLTLASIKGAFAFDFVADSSDRLDAQTRQANVIKAYNLMANSPSTNRRMLEEQVWRELGYDPKKMMAPPAAPVPDQPNISFRFSGEDLLNPMAVAIMLKSQEIGPDDIKAAALMIKDAVAQVQIQRPEIVPPAGPAPPAGPPPPAPVLPPETTEPILKRASDGSRLM